MGRTSTAAVAVVSSWQETLTYYIFISQNQSRSCWSFRKATSENQTPKFKAEKVNKIRNVPSNLSLGDGGTIMLIQYYLSCSYWICIVSVSVVFAHCLCLSGIHRYHCQHDAGWLAPHDYAPVVSQLLQYSRSRYKDLVIEGSYSRLLKLAVTNHTPSTTNETIVTSSSLILRVALATTSTRLANSTSTRNS